MNLPTGAKSREYRRCFALIILGVIVGLLGLQAVAVILIGESLLLLFFVYFW